MDLPSYARPASELIRQRYSCRKFIPSPIPEGELEDLRQFSASLEVPRGAPPRFEFFASKQGDAAELGAWAPIGMIQNPAAFVAVVKGTGCDILGLGWTTELLVLKATELGLGSCWLGGTFRHGRFSKAAKLRPGERLAIVIALGLEAEGAREGMIRRRVQGGTRKAWPEIFFDGAFERPIAGPADLARLSLAPTWADALEGLRLSPSASNKQPWALVKTQGGWEALPEARQGLLSALGPLARNDRHADQRYGHRDGPSRARSPRKGLAGEMGDRGCPDRLGQPAAPDSGALRFVPKDLTDICINSRLSACERPSISPTRWWRRPRNAPSRRGRP